MARLALFLLLPILVVALPAQAQRTPKPDAPSQPIRVEVEATPEGSWIEITVLTDSSVLVCVNKDPYRYSKSTYHFTKYNQALEVAWEKEIELPAGATYLQSYAEGPYGYYLFLGVKPTEYHMLRVEGATGDMQVTNHQKVTSMEFTGFKAIGDDVFIMAQEHQNLAGLHLNLATNQSKILPAVYDQQSALADFRIDTLTRMAEFVLSETNRSRSRLTVKQISHDGEEVITHFVLPQGENNLLTAQLAPGDSVHKLLLGTYIEREFRSAQGVFAHTLGGETSYHDFTTFGRFFDYMSKSGQRNIKRRIGRRKARNKDLKLRYKLLLHDVYQSPEGFVLVAEAYSPQYNSEFSLYNFRGLNSESAQGNRFSHAVVAGFDRQGNLLWDNSFPFQSISNRPLTPNVQVGFRGNEVILAYVAEDEIFYKYVERGQQTSNEEKVSVLTYTEKEKIQSTVSEGILHFYGSHFLAYGFHRVRPATGPSRMVFYLNKVSF